MRTARFRFAWAWFIAVVLLALPVAATDTLYHVTGIAKDAAGVAIAAATVTVKNSNGTATVTIYSSALGAAQANPITAGGDGSYAFWAPAGHYRIDSYNGTTHFSSSIALPRGTVTVNDLRDTLTAASSTCVWTSDTDGVLTCATGGGGGGSGTVTSVATASGVTGGTITDTGTIALDYTATLAGNPALAAGHCQFATTGIICEGATANTNEILLTVADPGADFTLTFPAITGTVVTTGDTGSVTATMVLDGTLINADLSASAAIAFSKLAALTDGHILVGSGANVATDVAVSGDATMANTGAITIGSAKVTVPKGGTGLATLTAHGVVIGEGTSNVAITAAGTAGQPLLSGGASADPSFAALSAANVAGAGTASKCARFDASHVLVEASGDCASGDTGGAPGGSNTQVQFNDSSAFGGDSGLLFNKTTDALTVGGVIVCGGSVVCQILMGDGTNNALRLVRTSGGDAWSGQSVFYQQAGASGDYMWVTAASGGILPVFAVSATKAYFGATQNGQPAASAMAVLQVDNFTTTTDVVFKAKGKASQSGAVIQAVDSADAITFETFANSAMHLKAVASPPVTCDGSHVGYIYIDSTAGAMCNCDGSVWTPTPLTGTCS